MTDQELKNYISNKENDFARLKKQWESFSNEVPQKLESLIRSGIKPEITRGNSSGSGSLTIGISFNANMDGAKAYLEKVKEDIPKKAEPIFLLAKELDQKINEVKEQDVEEKTLASLIGLFDSVVDYSQNLTVSVMGGNTIKVNADSGNSFQKGKWNEEVIKKANATYAKNHNISVSDVEKHKKYLNVKEQEKNAKTSFDMNKVRNEYVKLGSYLDSKELGEKTQEKANKLKEEEDKKARDLLNAQNNQYLKSLELFKNAVKKDDYKFVIASLNSQKNHNDSQELIKICNAKIREIEEEEEKERKYNSAKRLLAEDKSSSVEKGVKDLEMLGDYKDAKQLIAGVEEKRKELRKIAIKEAEEAEARYQEQIKESRIFRGLVSSLYNGLTAYVLQNGTVKLEDHGSYVKAEPNIFSDVSRWTNIKSVACVGSVGVVGLKWDGTCVYTENKFYARSYHMLNEVLSWRDIDRIESTGEYVVGLDIHGNCFCTTDYNNGNKKFPNEEVEKIRSWKNVKDIRCNDHATAIFEDGTVKTSSQYDSYGFQSNVVLADLDQNGYIVYTESGEFITSGKVQAPYIPSGVRALDLGLINGRANVLGDNGIYYSGGREIKNVAGIRPNTPMCNCYVTNTGNMYARNDGITEKIFDDRKYYLEKMHEKEREAERKAIEAAEAAKRAEEQRIRRQELEKQKAEYREAGVCQHCGGEFKKTLFGYKCVSCGRRKDY